MLKNIETGRTNGYHWHIRNIRTVLRCSYDEIFLGPKVNGSEMNALLKKPALARR
jgi:hypothetical protein